MLVFLKPGTTENATNPVRLRCPACRQLGSFEAVVQQTIKTLVGGQPLWLGQRRCPNPECLAHVFVAWRQAGKVEVSYPAERVDFDPKNIPSKITNTFEEALTCHASQAYTASAIMVRRTLEEICADKSATGKDLKARIANLGTKVILPTALLDGLDNLRLLGNDAAHVEAKDYDTIGKTEVELALDVTKEVLKAVYQLDDLVKRLAALKKTP